MIKRKYYVSVAFVFLLLLFSCSATKLKSVWKDTAYDGYVNNIMVVAIAARHDVRKFLKKSL